MEQISQKETSFFPKVNGKNKIHFVRSLVRARVYIFYTSKAIINAPDEKSCTHVVRTYVCVFSMFFFTERILFFSSVESARPSRDVGSK